MAVVSKAFKAVRPGDVYPSEIAVGENVTGELEDVAKALGCLAEPKAKAKGAASKTKAKGAAPENKAK